MPLAEALLTVPSSTRSVAVSVYAALDGHHEAYVVASVSGALGTLRSRL